MSGQTLHPEGGPLTIGWARFQISLCDIASLKNILFPTQGKFCHQFLLFCLSCNVWEFSAGEKLCMDLVRKARTILLPSVSGTHLQFRHPVWLSMNWFRFRQVSRIWITETVQWSRKWRQCWTSGCRGALTGSVFFHITCHIPRPNNLSRQISRLHKSCTKHTLYLISMTWWQRRKQSSPYNH